MSWPPDAPGLMIRCGQHRVLDAILDPAGTGDVWMGGPGLPKNGARRARTAQPHRVGCPTHGSHRIDLMRLASKLDLVTGHARRYLAVSDVEA